MTENETASFTNRFTKSDVDKIYEVYYALLSLAGVLSSADDGEGSYADAGNILKPIALMLADVCDASFNRGFRDREVLP